MWKLIFIEADNLMFSPTKTFTEAKDEDWGTSYRFYARLVGIFVTLAAIVLTIALWNFSTFGDMLAEIGIPTENLPAELRGLTFSSENLPLIVIFQIIIPALVSLITMPIAGGWMHIWVYLCGGRKGVEQTIKAMAYGSTPYLLFGWIPLIGLIFRVWPIAIYLASAIFGTWQIIITIIGIKEFHEISTLRAVLAYLLGTIIALTLAIWAFITFL